MTKYTDKQGRTWDKTSIQRLLDSNDTAALKALKIIYDNQTDDEQTTERTKYHNGKGFTGIDAEIMTSIYKWYERKGWVSPKQMRIIRRKVRRYWRQVLTAIVEKDEQTA